jgi:SH3-like domain-containing protein
MSCRSRRLSLWVVAWLIHASLWAGPHPGVIKGERTNVRSHPAFDGEVLCTLSKGDAVEVVEEVPGTGLDGAPRMWARIAMPAKVPIWVYGPYLDPASHVILHEYATLRAGPGRNYSELGRISQGKRLAVLREVDDWVQVEVPPGLFAFVASSLIDLKSQTPSLPLEGGVAGAAGNPPNSTHGGSRAIPPGVETDLTQTQSPLPSVPAPPTTDSVPASEPATGRPPDGTNAVDVVEANPEPETPPPGATRPTVGNQPSEGSSTTNAPPREVSREGIISRSWSPQSPGNFELRSIYGEGVVDFLVSATPEVNLARYRGRRVIVTGTEWRDSRWKTPMIRVTTVKATP